MFISANTSTSSMFNVPLKYTPACISNSNSSIVFPEKKKKKWKKTFLISLSSYIVRIPLHLKRHYLTCRRSCLEAFCGKGILRNFARFAGKYLCQSPVFNKVVGLRPATLLKQRFWHRYYLVSFVKFLRTPFFKEHLRWLLLKYYHY